MSRRAFALAVLSGALLPVAALASGGGSGPDRDFYVYMVDFLVLFVPVAWVVWPRAKKALADRHDAMKAELDDAKAKFAEAEGRMRMAEERLAHLNEETARLLEEFRLQGQAERDTMAQEGTVLSEKIRAESDFRLDQAAKMARAQLAESVVAKAFALVEGRLATRSGAGLPEGVVDRVVREVGNKPS